MQRKQATTIFLLVLAAAALFLCYIIAQPFLEPFFIAVMTAVVAYPIHTRIQARVHRPGPAALISTILVLVLFIIPTIVLVVAIRNEIKGLYDYFGKSSTEENGWNSFLTRITAPLIKWVGKYVDLSTVDVRGSLVQWLKNISKPLLLFGAQALSNVAAFVANVVVVFFTLYYLFKEGRSMREHLGSILPLDSSQSERLSAGIDNSIIANVHGCIAAGVAQGVLTGLAFGVLGLSSPVLWGMVTGLFSMVPVVGSAAVWAPAGIILIVSGHLWKGLILLVWGAAVVAQADNVVRPYVIAQRANLHPLLIFFAILGGVKAFGPLGLFVGPVVVSVTIVVFDMLREASREEQPIE